MPEPKRTQNPADLSEGNIASAIVSPLDPSLSTRRRHELAVDEFKAMEDELLRESGDVIHAALGFKDIDPEDDEPPDAWLERGWNASDLKRRMRVAKLAHKSQRDAPIGLKLAMACYVGISRVRAGDKQQIVQLNVQPVQVVMPQVQYEELEVEGRK